MEEPIAKTNNELAAERTDLAASRTALAASRSLMAWVRTGLSMIGFGFTAYKFLEGLPDLARPNAPRNAGLFVIGLGVVSVLFGWLEYRDNARALSKSHGIATQKFPLIMSALIGALGVLLFVTVLLKIA